jgi:hypothetical protein
VACTSRENRGSTQLTPRRRIRGLGFGSCWLGLLHPRIDSGPNRTAKVGDISLWMQAVVLFLVFFTLYLRFTRVF